MKPGASVCGVATRRHSFLVLLTEAHFVTLRASPPPPRSFAPTDGRTDGRTMWAFRPARYHCRGPSSACPVRSRRRSSAVTDNNARFFDNLRRPRWRRPRVRCWRVRRGRERGRERKGAAARDRRHHLLNGKKRTWPQSIRTKQTSCHFWSYGRPVHLFIWFSFHITAAAGSDR